MPSVNFLNLLKSSPQTLKQHYFLHYVHPDVLVFILQTSQLIFGNSQVFDRSQNYILELRYFLDLKLKKQRSKLLRNKQKKNRVNFFSKRN